MRATVAVLTILLSAATAFAGPPSDGVYACVLEGRQIGSIKIEGDSYSGPARDGDFGSPAKFVMLGPDRIFWLGEMAELAKAGYRVDHTVARDDKGATVFDIVLLKPDQSGYVSANCSKGG